MFQDTDCFILGGRKRNRQTWLPSLKWEKRKTSKKCATKSKKGQKEQEKCSEIRKNGEDLMELQDDAEMHNESSSLNIEESQSSQCGRKNRKSQARSSLSPCSSPSRLSPDKSPFVQSLFINQQEEHSENQLKVLVTCSQSQSLGWHQAQKSDQACENLMEPISDIAVEETQWPSSTNLDDDETQILEDNPTDRGEYAVCLENVSFHEVREKDIHEGVRHEPVENKNLGSLENLGGWSSSQDLFPEPSHQESPLKDTSVENVNEDLESHQTLHDDVDPRMKKRKRLILAEVEGDHVTSQPTKMVSPAAGNILHERKENNTKVSDESVEHVYAAQTLEACSSRSRGNDFTSPCKDILMVRQEEKAETPLFMYGGIKFLKRRKGKKPAAPKISDNSTPAPAQTDPCQNEGSTSHIDDTFKQKKRKNAKNDELLEEPVGTLPGISLPADSSHDSSVVSVSVGETKSKKKRKKDKREQPMPQNDQWIGLEEALPIPCQDCDPLLSIAGKTEQLAETDLSSPSLNHEVNRPDGNTQVNEDLVQSDGPKPKRKKKKVKKRDLGPVMPDEEVAPQCSEEPQSKHGTKTVKNKKQKFIDEGEMTTVSKNLDEPLDKILEIPAGLEIQPMSSVDLTTGDYVTPRKKKKRKRQEEVRDVEALLVETADQVKIPNTYLDSEQQEADVVLLRKLKKRKKKKDRTETRQEEEASENATSSNTPSARSETGGTAEEEGLGGSEPVKKKKKKKKRKESESNGSVSCDSANLCNAKETRVVEEALGIEQKLDKKHPAPCLETTTNEANKKSKRKEIKDDAFECSQQILHSEDTIPPEGKKKHKKKKKRLVAKDIEGHPEIVEHDMCQESGSPYKPPEATIAKKKKNRKHTVDAGQSESLSVPSELSAAEEPRDVLVTGHAKGDSISSLGPEVLVNIKKKKGKKQVKDSEIEVDITVGTEQS